MKRLLFGILTLVLCLGLAGCGASLPDGMDEESVQQAAELAIAMQAAGEPRAMPLDYEDVNVGAKVVKLIQSYTPIVNETVWLKR